MTLLATEIHARDDGAVVVFAADRRISRGDVARTDQKKVFRVPNLSAGIGFFGLAEVPTGVGRQSMSDWVQDFLYTVRFDEQLAGIAERLADALNTVVPTDWQLEERSGFHLAGFNSVGEPEFWFVRNVDDAGEPTLGQYEPREDFVRRDLRSLPANGVQIYRNGDIRAHVTAWKKIDEAFGSLLGTPDFRSITTPVEYEEWVHFKMTTIAEFYDRFCIRSLIGKPIDAFAFSRAQFYGV